MFSELYIDCSVLDNANKNKNVLFIVIEWNKLKIGLKLNIYLKSNKIKPHCSIYEIKNDISLFKNWFFIQNINKYVKEKVIISTEIMDIFNYKSI